MKIIRSPYIALLACALALTGCNDKGTEIQLPSGEKLTLEGTLQKNITKQVDSGTIKHYDIQYSSNRDVTTSKIDEKLRALGYVPNQLTSNNENSLKFHYHKKETPIIGVMITEKTSTKDAQEPTLVSIYWQNASN